MSSLPLPSSASSSSSTSASSGLVPPPSNPNYLFPIHPNHLPQDYDQEHTARPENAYSHAAFHNSSSSPHFDHRSSSPAVAHYSLSRPLSQDEQDRLAHLDRLKFF